MYVVVFGNPLDGLEIVGPFQDADDALHYADCNLSGETWWTYQLSAPVELSVPGK